MALATKLNLVSRGILFVGFAAALPVHAQDARDAEIFGAPSPHETPPSVKKSAPTATTPSATTPSSRDIDQAASLADSMQIGGRLELQVNSSEVEELSPQKGALNNLKQADLYFDSRPNKDLRAFLRARLTEGTPASVTSPLPTPNATAAAVQTDIDELWLKWDVHDTAYVTAGKQHLKWGSGHFWNPTDFTAQSTRDPFDLYDRRLGQELIKVHVPFEKQGHNIYAVLQFDDVAQNDDVGAALRGEFSFLGSGEIALTAAARPRRPFQLGADISSALGPLDFNVELAANRNENRDFYQGALDPTNGRFPTTTTKTDIWFGEVVSGLQKTFKYTDKDNLTVGVEYFYNQLGYEDHNLELYSLLLNQSQPLYAGRRYVGLYATLPTPGSWDNTSFYFNGLRNLSDETTVLRFTATYLLFHEATADVFVSRCYGDYGEMCFRIPESYLTLANAPGVNAGERQVLLSLPTKRTLVTAGAGITINF